MPSVGHPASAHMRMCATDAVFEYKWAAGHATLARLFQHRQGADTIHL